MFDGGNHQIHQCQRLIDKLAKEGKSPPQPPGTPQPKVRRPIPSPNTLLSIASLNNGKSVELVGQIGNREARVLVDGAAQVNACTNSIMEANPNRNTKHINRKICSFDGHVAVPSKLAYESTLNTEIPGLFKGNVTFVEAPIKSHDAILGLPRLESVNPDIDWTTKTMQQRQPVTKTPLTHTDHTDLEDNSFNISNPLNSPLIKNTTNNSLGKTMHTENDLTDEILIRSLVRDDAQQEDEKVIIPDSLKFLSEAFSKSSAAKLPPHRNGVDMIIDIPDGKLPRVIPMSRLSEREKEEP
ncbi:hypothetical protein K3495_g3548 [Podosphaera aphanis]|nr:hypothetical protein K3495_g3548 [Podosphaera aphanis]